MRGVLAGVQAELRTLRESPALAAAFVDRYRSQCRDQGRDRMNEVKR
jgi:hypothetical protein